MRWTLLVLLPFLAAMAPMARVLSEDPPLPGEPLDGWEALAAPADGELDVEGAVALALERSPELAAYAAEIDAARGARLAASALPNPTWELAFRLPDPTLASIRVEVDVTDLLLAPIRSGAAGPDVEAARLRAAEAAIRVGYEARAAFFDHQAALAGWRAAIRAVDGLAASRDAARAQVAAGNLPLRDLAVREGAYEDARLRAAALEVDVVTTRERLARRIAGPVPTLSPLLPPAPAALDLPSDPEGDVLAASLDLRARDATLCAARRRTTSTALGALVPDVDLFVVREADGETIGGFEGSFPLFGVGRGDIIRASAVARGAVADREFADIEVRSAAREAAARLQSAHARALHVQDVIVPVRERVLQETLLQYNAMQVGIDVLLLAWRQRIDADVALADTLRELWTARAAMDALLAGARVAPPRTGAAPTTDTEPGGD